MQKMIKVTISEQENKQIMIYLKKNSQKLATLVKDMLLKITKE
jgi:hypothetical protein